MNVCSFFYMSIFFKKTNILEHLRPPGDQRHREGERDDFFQDNLQENGDYHMIITLFNQRNERICWFPRKLDAWTWLYVINEHTVDGRNPAPVDIWFIPLLLGFQPSKVVQDFFHPQYVQIVGTIVQWCCGEETP